MPEATGLPTDSSTSKALNSTRKYAPSKNDENGQILSAPGLSNKNSSQSAQDVKVPASAPVPARLKYEMCKNWREKGNCRYGEKCLFAHGEHELTKKQVSQANSTTATTTEKPKVEETEKEEVPEPTTIIQDDLASNKMEEGSPLVVGECTIMSQVAINDQSIEEPSSDCSKEILNSPQ